MSATPSKRFKYATEEERKAAARERQRLYAARKRAEAKEAKLRAESLANSTTTADDDTSFVVAQPQPTPSPTKAKRGPKKADSTPAPAPVVVVDSVNVATPATARKRRVSRKKVEDGVNGDGGNGEDHGIEISTFEISRFGDSEFVKPKFEDDIGLPSPSLSFSEELTSSDFLPAPYNSSDHILIPPQPSPTSQLNSFLTPTSPVQSYAILHLPGNPGLISYYTNYLESLSLQLSNASIPSAQFTIFGASLGGFNVSSTKSDPKLPLGYCPLHEQISRQVSMITHLLTLNPNLKIILTGHSLGAYLLLSAIHQISTFSPQLKNRIIGGIGLFPAVTHIAKSSSGRKISPFIKVPGLLSFLVLLSNFLVAIVPAAVWGFLVKIFMPAFEGHARKATVDFLKSPRGIRQGILLGRDELLGIKDDVWDESVWGDESNASTELVFYFGHKDHWVFDEEREKLIEKRGRGGRSWVEDEGDLVVVEGKDGWKPRMMVCEEGVRHSFCVSAQLSELMAAKTARWVEDIVMNDRIKYGL
ncbi:hypothetical protein TWF694_000850 [Orbilia ellipsospora]|uniref:AB hydrolase-1 domain-containing protein n=1 Tax=Orbilia ellipsospora TaxID=2528407 RepID=A0AAV9XWI0_9PEZI